MSTSNITTVIHAKNPNTNERALFISTDGITFTVEPNISATLQQCNAQINFIEYNGSNWLMGGGLSDDSAALYRSSDGSNWSTVTLTGLALFEDLRNLAMNPTASIFVTPYSFLRSTDLVTFTQVTNSPESIFLSNSYFKVRASASTFLAFIPQIETITTSVLSNIVYNSTDGITWTENTQINGILNSIQQSNSTITFDDFKYNGRKWLGVLSVTSFVDPLLNKIYTVTSTNAITWYLHSNIQSTLLPANSASHIAASDTLWVIGNINTNSDSNSPSYSPNSFIYSSNGINWTGVPITLTTDFSVHTSGVKWNGLRWVASGSRSSQSLPYMLYSEDAINWAINTEVTDVFQQSNFNTVKTLATSFIPSAGSNPSNPYTYQSALATQVPSDPVDKEYYFAAIMNNFSNYSSSTAVTVSSSNSSNLVNYYRTLVPSIPVGSALRFLPTNSNAVVSQSVISSLSNGNYVVFPDNYPVTIAGKTYAVLGNSLIITTSGVPATVSSNGEFTVYNKTLRFLTAGSPAVTVVTATASNPPCFLEGTKILCLVDEKEQYITIESLTKGTLVKTLLEGYKPVTHLGYSKMTNSGLATRERNQMYVCTPEKYPTLTEPLYITGCHSILVHKLTDYQKEETLKVYGRLFDTEYKYRLEAYLDERAGPWSEKGECTVWHVALENDNETWNYGIYANGLLVESISKRAITTSKTLSLMF